MRDIKFKGIRIDNGDWIVGCLYCEQAGCYIKVSKDSEYPVIPETVGHLTGLIDKNGQQIFEGDFVKDHTGRMWLISWDNERAGYIIIAQEGVRKKFDGRIGPMHVAAQQYRMNEMELAGNIHEKTTTNYY